MTDRELKLRIWRHIILLLANLCWKLTGVGFNIITEEKLIKEIDLKLKEEAK